MQRVSRIPCWPAWCSALAVAAALGGCGGASDAPAIDAPEQVPTPEAGAGNAPAIGIALAEPTNVVGTKRIQLTWSASGGASSFTVLVKRSERDEFEPVSARMDTNAAEILRGTAWRYDFPTARIKVRGCTPSQNCADSNEQPLLRALLGSVVALGPHPAARASFFGASVALDGTGDTLAVTDVNDLSSFHVFQREAQGTWQREFYQQRQLPVAYGHRVALSRDGNTLVASHPHVPPLDRPDSLETRGVASVWLRDAAGAWQRQAVLQPDCACLVGFGNEIALSDNGRRLAVASITQAFVFSLDENGHWRNEPLPPSARGIDTPFGVKLAMSGDGQTLALGGREQIGTLPTGERRMFWSVWVFKRSPDIGWTHVATLRSPKGLPIGANDDLFGNSLALDHGGATLAVAARTDSSDHTDTTGSQDQIRVRDSGAVYIFERSDDGTWQQRAFVKPRNAAPSDLFGTRIVLSRDGAVLMGTARGQAANVPGLNRNHAPDQPVPAPNEGNRGGAVYVFELHEGRWTQRATVIPPYEGGPAIEGVGLALNADGHTFSIGLTELPGVHAAFVY